MENGEFSRALTRASESKIRMKRSEIRIFIKSAGFACTFYTGAEKSVPNGRAFRSLGRIRALRGASPSIETVVSIDAVDAFQRNSSQNATAELVEQDMRHALGIDFTAAQ